MDFRGLKKVCTVNSDENDKVSLVERVFQTHLQTSSDSLAHAIVSLQRYDAEWEDLVDIDMAQIKHRDKIKVQIIDNRDPDNSRKSSTRTTDGTSAAGLDSPASIERVNKPGVGVEQLIKNLEDQRRALDYKFSISKAKLESLKVAPRDRGLAGRYSNFTCSSCHYKGHRINNCMLQPCRGYFECGQLSLHREHRDDVKKVS